MNEIYLEAAESCYTTVVAFKYGIPHQAAP